MVCLLLLVHITSLWLLFVVAEGRAGMDLQPADISHIFFGIPFNSIFPEEKIEIGRRESSNLVPHAEGRN